MNNYMFGFTKQQNNLETFERSLLSHLAQYSPDALFLLPSSLLFTKHWIQTKVIKKEILREIGMTWKEVERWHDQIAFVS